jgi:hypothetical protein
VTFQPKFGRRPNNAAAPRVRLRALTAGGPALVAPETVDWHSAVDPDAWGMDGNDRIGDCTIAEVDHTTKATEAYAGNPLAGTTDAEVLAAYSAITGYDPDRPDTDQGAEMQAVRAAWRRDGITLGGETRRIVLFAEVDVRDLRELRWALAHFGPVGLGIICPRSALEQFDAGQDWTVVPGSPEEGGHAISLVGYDADWWYVVTWGRVVRVAPEFFSTYVEEAWTQLSEEWVSAATGRDPLAETLYDLGGQFERLTGQPNPFPAPGPDPIPSPAPPVPGGGELPFLDADAGLAGRVDRLVHSGRYPSRQAVVMHALRSYFRRLGLA